MRAYSEALKDAVRRSGLSQREAAARFKISPSTVKNILRESRTPKGPEPERVKFVSNRHYQPFRDGTYSP